MTSLINDEVIMGEEESVQLDPNVNQDEVVLYKCEDCSNLFSSWELVQNHLDGPHCTAAKKDVEQMQESAMAMGADGSLYIMEGLEKEDEGYSINDALQVLDHVFKPPIAATKRPLSVSILPPAKRGPGRPRGTKAKKKEKDPSIFSEPFPDEPTYSCSFCGAVFKSVRGLDSHVEIHQNQSEIACDVCNKSFVSLRELKSHRELHTGKDRDVSLICDVCGEEFGQRSFLKAHVANRHAAELAYICEYCEAAFLTNQELDMHLVKCQEKAEYTPKETAPTSGEYTCGICQKTYKNITNLARHVQKIHREAPRKGKVKAASIEKQVPCGLCYELFADLEGLQGHECMALPAGAEITTYMCPVCEETFVSETFLELHSLLHTTEEIMEKDDEVARLRKGSGDGDGDGRDVVELTTTQSDFTYCKKCGQIFTDLDALNEHINDIHFGPNLLECEVCTEVLGSQVQLDEHKSSHDAALDLPYPCKMCPRRFKRQYLLASHVKEHNWDTPFECPECGLCYASPDDLSQHEKTDHPQNERPVLHQPGDLIQCDVCDKVLQSKESLQSHSRIHTGERPFQCEHCPRAFRRRSEIEQHKAVHTGDRKFQCDLCDQSFKYRNNLDAHRRTHGKKAFGCDLCSKKYSRKAYLEQHLKEHEKRRAAGVVEVHMDSVGEQGGGASAAALQGVEVISANEGSEFVLRIADGQTIDTAALIAKLGSHVTSDQ